MKIHFVFILAALISGCGASSVPVSFNQDSPQVSEGLLLAAKSQCLSCHALERKVIGPAWNDVSKRYNDEINFGKAGEKEIEDKLVKKIAMGGKGNWINVTGGMSMPPNYPRVSLNSIRKLAQFILSLKK